MMERVLRLGRWSLEGRSREPQRERTSSRAWACHCGCMARRMVVHVRRFEVVYFPAKKKLLHSSTISSTVTSFDDDLEASIISPIKSLGDVVSRR